MKNCSETLKHLNTRLNEKRNLYKELEKDKNQIQNKINIEEVKIITLTEELKERFKTLGNGKTAGR